MASRNNRGNDLVVPGVADALEKFKYEIAEELGIENYDTVDKGALPARVHGMIGGTMTKRLIEMGQQALNGQSTETSNLNYEEYPKHMEADLNNQPLQ